MANATPIQFSDANVVANIENPAINKITNLTIALADTETSHTLQANLKRLEVVARNDAQLKISFVLGDSGTIFKTIPPGNIYSTGDIDLVAGILYIQTSIAGTIVEIEEWS